MSTFFLPFILLSFAGAPQEAAAPDEGWRLLAELDGRLYRATDHGLAAISFTYEPKVEGMEAAPFRVRYRWREGLGDRVDFVGEDGAVLEKVPEIPGLEKARPPGGEKIDPQTFLPEAFLTASRGFAQAARGVSLCEQYRGFRVQVARETRNHREVVSLVLEPSQPKKLRRLRITLDQHGLPWEWERSYLDGSSVLQHHDYRAHDGRFLLVRMQETVTPAGSATGVAYAYETQYQKVRGLYVPSSIAKLGPALPAWAKGRTDLRDVLVNEDVPAFEPMKP